jgi:hypothetical protein
VERFLSRCSIRDRDSHVRIPFVLNYNQKLIHQKAKEQYESGQPVRILVDKARRVGVSSWSEGLLFCHCLSLPGSHAMIAAHEFKSSKALFSIPMGFADSVPFLNIDAVEREMRFPHPSSESLLQIITAGKKTSGRGFTLSALHMSEGAHYESPEPYISMLPAVSNHRNTIIIIETTPNGMEGEGEPFYLMWLDAIAGKNDYIAVFLSWTDDPACVAPEEMAKDAPIDEEEKDLLKRGLSRAQLAWRRMKINSPECGGFVDNFHQEFPVTWEESFITSGMPAFTPDEKRWVRKNVRPPKHQGFLERRTNGTWDFRSHHNGDLRIWEDPKPGHYYYVGLDAARGEEGRDFSAAVCFDGTTGHQVFTYAAHSVPEHFAAYMNSAGRRYNKAMLNPELTGGYGYAVLSALRDAYRYPNLYYWKGKDDKTAGSTVRRTFGFETTGHTRTILFEMLRVGLREAAATDGDFGITIYDEQLASQIDLSTRKDTRVDVEKGHDDILFGAMLANIALRHWAPPRNPNPSRSKEADEERAALQKMRDDGHVVEDDHKLALQRHHDKIARTIKSYRSDRELEMEEV